MFDGTIRKFAQKMVVALQEQADVVMKADPYMGLPSSSRAIVAVTLLEFAKVIIRVAELE